MGGGDLKLSGQTQSSSTLLTSDFLPPVLGDWVGGEMIVAAVCVDVRGVMSLHCEPTQGWRRENEEGAVREAGGWLLLA